MKIIVIILVGLTLNLFAVGELVWLERIFNSAKDIAEKASDFSKSVDIAEDLKLIEQEQSEKLGYQSKFMKDIDESNSVLDYIDNQVKVDHDTIRTLDSIHDASELTDKYFGYSPYEEVYIKYSDQALKTINDALADAEKSGEINSQDAHNKMDAYQNSKIIIEQAKTNDLLAQQLTNQAVQQQLAQEQAEKDRQSIVTRSNDDRIFFRKYRRFMR